MMENNLWVQESNSVMCSRYVKFDEKIINSGKVVRLPIVDEDKITFEYKNEEKVRRDT